MSADRLDELAKAACDVTFPARHRLFEDGGDDSRFWLIQSGHVSLDLRVPGEAGDHRASASANSSAGHRCSRPTGRVRRRGHHGGSLQFNTPAVRKLCAADPGLGYEFNQHITRVLATRLQATRIRLIARSGHAAAVH